MKTLFRLLRSQITLAALLLLPIMSHAENPQLTIKALNCLQDVQVPAGICAVSNVKRIELEVTLDKKGNNSLKPLSETPVNPAPANLPSNYVVVKAAEDQGGAAVAVKAAVFEKGGTGTTETVKLTLEIMENETVRANKIQTFINEAKARDVASGAASQAQANKLTEQNAAAVSALEKLYVENRLGRFKVTVEYHSTQQSAWTGQVSSAPITVDVQNKGSFFDGL